MKKLCVSIILILLNLEAGSVNPENKKRTLNVRIEKTKKVEVIPPLIEFKAKMSLLESNGDYKVVNRFGYMGKYQFGKSTLKLLQRKGYIEHFTYKEFLENEQLQEKAMDALIKVNKEYIYRNKLNLYIGKKIMNTKITMNGLLASSHLVGPFAVKKFLHTDGRVNKKDGNGTSVVDYLREFENESIIY